MQKILVVEDESVIRTALRRLLADARDRYGVPIMLSLETASGVCEVEFDLAYSKLNEKRVEKAWIDLIFEGPEMNQITLRDLTFSRRPRAAL